MRRSCQYRLGLSDDIEAIERAVYKGRLNRAWVKVADLFEEPLASLCSGPWTGTRLQVPPPRLVGSINPPETIVFCIDSILT